LGDLAAGDVAVEVDLGFFGLVECAEHAYWRG
jgi:hypothetical protein